VHLIGPVRKYTNYTILAAASQIESNAVRSCKDRPILMNYFILDYIVSNHRIVDEWLVRKNVEGVVVL
jgi:hypothetical protein